MDLWQGDLPDFISAASGPRLAADMARAFTRIHRRRPTESEHVSWEESLAAIATVADDAATDDVGVLVEYHLPLSDRRIDVMFFGRRAEGGAGTLLVELKRWESVSLADDWALNVLIGDAEHVHPSQQALDYAGYLSDTHSAYVAQEIAVRPCAYCHEMSSAVGRTLRESRFADLLNRSPLFVSGEGAELAELLNREVGGGSGVSLMEKVRSGSFRPSKGIVQSLDAVLHHDDEWHLLDEQRLAFNAIWAEVQRLKNQRERSAVLVRGGPGTGKSVIAVQLLAEALRAGLAAVHSTGGKAFTTVMRGTFTGAQPLFAWNRTLRHARPMELDLLLTDEAHRIRENSDNRWTKKAERNRRSQIDELLDAAKVSVFFLDEHQYMRPDEIGNTRLVEEATERRGIVLREYDLSAQFRCGGSREYVEFVDYLLGFRREPPHNWKGYYSFEMARDPDDLETVLDLDPDASARLVAGFCWKWSDPRADGSLVEDVVIGDWRRAWNRKEAKNKVYKPENHPYTLWATTSEGPGQVGCIYSAQGFEFDRVGVIWGPDLVWRDGHWLGQKRVGNKRINYDPGLGGAAGDQLTRLLRHAYRVLLTRGVRGTRVLCLDPETSEHLVGLLAALDISREPISPR
jgi:uncharacterized protein